MKINNLIKTKIKILIELVGEILIAVVISIIAYFILSLFFENSLAILVENLNYELYEWIVHNRQMVLYIYIGTITIIIMYRFISKYVHSISKIYNSLDKILKEDNESIKLPDDINQFSEKMNKIKYDYISAKNRQRDAEQKKNDLIMYMAHDLKTPLTSIIGYLTLLSDEKNISKESQEKYIKIALDKSLRVEELINQFFDITRYNLHSMPINKSKINITYLLKQLVDECYPMLEKKKLKCVLEAPDKVIYTGDGDKLARAFDNLLKNAINYSYEETEIKINLVQKDNKIFIAFINKGDKIPEYKLEKIFEKFYRGDSARITSTGGAGLGLAITKEIIDLHGGFISVKNDNEYIEFDIEL